MKNGNNTILLIIIVATIFGLGSGMVGAIVARVYVLEDALNLPLFGEIDFSSTGFGGSNLVISGAKKVVVEQNDKVTETYNSVKNNILGIYNQKATSTAALDTPLNAEALQKDYYNLDEELGQAFILTSDGWIITSFLPPELAAKIKAKSEPTAAEMKQIASNYVMISKNKEIFEVDEIVIDPETSYAFWHIKATGLPVKQFIGPQDVANGELIVSLNWDGGTWISSIVEKDQREEGLVQDSDVLNTRFRLADQPGEDFYGSFVFNLNGDVLAMIDQTGEVEPIYNYTACISCLLKSNEIKRPSFGVYYIDLAGFASVNNSAPSPKGALIAKNEQGVAVKVGSPASIAGLQEGDLIISVNNILLDQNSTLAALISQYQVEDELAVVYERDGLSKTITLTLAELK